MCKLCLQTLYTFERVDEITCQNPETPHEQWFQETYSKQIQEALEKLRNPTNPAQPHTSWQGFKQVPSYYN